MNIHFRNLLKLFRCESAASARFAADAELSMRTSAQTEKPVPDGSGKFVHDRLPAMSV